MCFQPLKNCTESEQRCKWFALPPPLRWQNYQGATKPKIWISTPSCLIPSTTFCWHCEIKCFFSLSGHGNPMSSQIPYCAGGAEKIFVEVPAPVSVMFPHKKPLASLSFHQELKDCFAPEARKKIAFKPLHSEKPKNNLKKNQTEIMHFRNRGRPPQRGSARQFFGNHFHSILRRRAVHFHRELFFFLEESLK